MTYATRHPDHPGRLIVCSSIARWRIDRTLDAFECLGGREAREVARRFWDNPTYESSVEYMAMAAPLIVPLAKKRSFTEQDAAFFKRHIAHPFPNQEVGDFFLAGEWQTFNLLPALKRIKCPTIVLSDVDPLASSKDAENMVAAMPKALVQYEHFPEAGHGIAGDSPEQFFSVVRRFITA
jgi:pimeloyl-ACP methyl ester carboxylesterase